MNSIRLLTCQIAIAFSLSDVRAHSQSTFQNLNFEDALVSQDQAPGYVSVSSALPGWTAYISSNQVAQVGFNEFCLGTTCINLVGTNTPLVIEGGFSLLLQAGVIFGPGGALYPAPASIFQIGLVPANSRSIMFAAQAGSGSLSVSLGGVSIPYFPISTGPTYNVYAGDISVFAGQTWPLEISLSGYSGGADYPTWYLDAIQFSPSTIPEPGGAALIALGLGAAAMRLLGRRRWGALLLQR